MMSTTNGDAPSLHVAHLFAFNLVAVGSGNKILLFRLSLERGDIEAMHKFEDVQCIRGVSFMVHSSSGKVLLFTAGDAKFVSCFDVTGATASTDVEKTTVSVGTRLLTYGPHSKKIATLTTADYDVIFADKFGEVYKITVGVKNPPPPSGGVELTIVGNSSSAGDAEDGSESDVDEDDERAKKSKQSSTVTGNPSGEAETTAKQNNALALLAAAPQFSKSTSQFALQHLSLVLHTLITEAPSRRIVSCDRDGHVRVSRYPQTYVIEQYLWNVAPQVAVTAALELTPTDCEGTVLVFGDYHGRVTFWSNGGTSAAIRLDSNTTNNNSKHEFHRIDTLHLLSSAQQDELAATSSSCVGDQSQESSSRGGGSSSSSSSRSGGVVALAFLYHSQGDAAVVLAALEGVDELVSIPVRIGGYSIEVCQDQITRTTLSRPCLAIAKTSSNQALLILRGNAATTHFVASIEADRPGESCRVSVTEVHNSVLATELNELVGANGGIDPFAHWRPTTAKDPRVRPAQTEVVVAMEGDENDDSKGQQQQQRKKARGENS